MGATGPSRTEWQEWPEWPFLLFLVEDPRLHGKVQSRIEEELTRFASQFPLIPDNQARDQALDRTLLARMARVARMAILAIPSRDPRLHGKVLGSTGEDWLA